jgi:predicted nucleic acid-binding protein
VIVVDTNVLVYYFIEGEKSLLAHQLFVYDPEWIVPLLWRHEFVNILATFARTGTLAVDVTQSVWRNAREALYPHEASAEPDEIIPFAVQNNISAHDAEFLVLAKSRRILCVTEDKELQKKCPHVAVSMGEFLRRFQ